MNVAGVNGSARGNALGRCAVVAIDQPLLQQRGKGFWKWLEWLCVQRFKRGEVALGKRRIRIARRIGLIQATVIQLATHRRGGVAALLNFAKARGVR